MGYLLSPQGAQQLFDAWRRDFRILAPKCFTGGATYSGLDCVRYGEVMGPEEIVFDRKSDYSWKEALLPLCQTLLYFTEEQVKQADPPPKGTIVFLRSCDLHALARLDQIYLESGREDFYYRRLRERTHLVVMGCQTAFDSCFCVDMGTNVPTDYDLSFEPRAGGYALDCRREEWDTLLRPLAQAQETVVASHVTRTKTRVQIPDGLDHRVDTATLWQEYDRRCIACGRCNFVCPTCTCFTMQDLFYSENGRVGERRRVHASCMVDGFPDVAGGGCSRKVYGERMRYKTLHKILDHHTRFGCQMCVGCGRCDDICPEYISFSGLVGRLGAAVQEVNANAVQ